MFFFMHTLCEKIHAMDLLMVSLFILSMASSNLWIGYGQTFDVLRFGAKGDGNSDDSQAFLEAWKALCGANDGTPTLVVPAGHTYFVRQTIFRGPCQSQNIRFKIMGNILAPRKNAWGACSRHWLYFLDVRGMTIDGSGTVNGQGESWWDNHGTDGCTGIPPVALLFEKCDGLQISGLTHINGPGSHIFVVHSQNVTISHIQVNSPKDSHNTDGIDLANSVRVNILDSIIESGDDCIAIKGGSQFINITQVTCGPGDHGISVGSLGNGGEEEFVEHVNVLNCTFNGADSAARIKTWPGGKGYARAIIFDHIRVDQTNYPIYIEQHYMHAPEKKDAVKVSDITFSNIYGTCTGENAVVLDCAKIGCDNIILKQINITSIDPKHPASASCNNVRGIATDIISPSVRCLQH